MIASRVFFTLSDNLFTLVCRQEFYETCFKSHTWVKVFYYLKGYQNEQTTVLISFDMFCVWLKLLW